MAKRSVVTITPRMAAKWLKCNANNRPLSMGTVKSIAAAITSGEWRLNGETIKFNCSDALLDGQHRLHAVLLANIPIESYVVWGITEDAFDTIDQGKKRNCSDVFARRGETNYKLLAGAIRKLYEYETYGAYDRGHHLVARNDQLISTLEENPGMRDVVHIACTRRPKHLSAAELSFCLYKTRQLWGAEKVDSFWLSVADVDGLQKGTPGYVLFKRLNDNLTSTAKLRPGVRIAFCIKAFNAFITGGKCGILRLCENEDAPRFFKPA